MNSPLKLSVLFFAFFFTIIHHSIGQDSLEVLMNSWLKLKTQLQRRTDITINLASVISKSGNADKDLIEMIKSTARDLSLFIDSTKNLDSVTVQETYQKNNSLTQALSKALVVLMDDTKLKSQEELRNLQMQIEMAENRVVVAKRNYNDICVERKRPDLIFENIQKKRSP
jgi:hypothetical protein